MLQIYIHTDSRINRYNISNMKIIIALLLTICVAIATATTVKQQIQQLAASKSPADNIIALLGQVKETLEHIDESSTARGAERERHCLKREKIMVNRLSALKQKAGIKDDDEGDKNDEKEQSKAANAAAKLDRAIKKRKGDRLLQQFRSTKYLAERLQAGFSGDMESYALASNVRDAGHTAFVEHQSRYNSYTHVLESMVSIMEQHFANGKKEGDNKDDKKDKVLKEPTALIEVSGDSDDLEWESADAHRVHTYLSELLSQFDREQAMEHSIEEAMYVAHDEAMHNRDASKERLDHLLKKINGTKRSIGKELRALGFSTDGKKLGLDGSSKKSNATKLKMPGSVTKDDIDNTDSELKAWKQECEERKAQAESARKERIAQIKMVARLEETIMERLMIVKNTLMKKEEKAVGEEGTDSVLGHSNNKALGFDDVAKAGAMSQDDKNREAAKNKIAQAFLKHAKATSDSNHLLQPAKV